VHGRCEQLREVWATRADVNACSDRGASLLGRLLLVAPRDRDAWVDELLGWRGVPPDVPDLPRGSVPYLPCGVNEILAMVQEVPVLLEDELVDLGSGLGRVVILTHLLTGAVARGIEIQAPLVVEARARARELGLSRVSFTHADARDTALDGSSDAARLVFFLYAPFNGAMLMHVVRRLEEVAERRAIVICAVDLELPSGGWLRRRESRRSPVLAIYDSDPAR